ncbi:hypothetical protein [Rufibacter sp. LB8]|uniref:hypothetical protein n=1 Tax=Rufibacter sp. LB8 TaxID=2777781 RepID=UPI00178C70DE|nr:hypothetical protein [Rufibacter sp. LB8]
MKTHRHTVLTKRIKISGNDFLLITLLPAFTAVCMSLLFSEKASALFFGPCTL